MDNGERVTYFASTDGHGESVPFGIKKKDRNKHVYALGKTGMGKSTLLHNMAVQDIRNGESLIFIDPFGATAEKLLEYVPEHRINDVVYFAPFDLENPVAFNVLEDVAYEKRHIVVQGLLATFSKMWEREWNSRIEFLLSNTLLALLEYPGTTLLSIHRIFNDTRYRERVTNAMRDPIARDFWNKEFVINHEYYVKEAIPTILNKFTQVTSNATFRNIIGQPKSSFDFRTIMDERRIFIANLSKGLIGEANMQLLGSMLLTHLFLSATSRANVSARELERLPDCYLYLDEFQNFANSTFAEVLSESRKYKLNLTFAHQYLDQVDSKVQAAILGNVGTMISFRIGPVGAERLETIFGTEFSKSDLVALGIGKIYLTLQIDGVGSHPFSGVIIPPIEKPVKSFRRQVVEHSQKTFGRNRTDVEKNIHETIKTFADVPVSEAQSVSRKDTLPTPLPPPVASHTESGKPVSDLRSALSHVIEKTVQETERVYEDRFNDLKTTIASVMTPPPVTQKQTQTVVVVQQQPAVVPEKPVEKPVAPPAHVPEKETKRDGIFEIAEKELRAIFKDNL